MGPSGWAEARWTCERLRPACGSWEVDSEARTLAAAEAAVLGGRKRRSRPGRPDAVRTGWARTLASRLSGWTQSRGPQVRSGGRAGRQRLLVKSLPMDFTDPFMNTDTVT